MALLLNEAVESKKMDTRLIERNVTKGLLSHEEVQSYTQQLPDESENADWISVDELSKI
jgi:hypothetical protein